MAVPDAGAGYLRTMGTPAEHETITQTRSVVATMLEYVRLQRWTAGEITRAAIGWSFRMLALLPIPILVKMVFDDAIAGGDTALLVWIGAGMIALQGLSYVGLLLARPIAIRKAWQTGAMLRNRVLDALYRRSLVSVRSRQASDLHDLMVHEVERVDGFGVAINSLIIPPIAFSVALVILLLVINWWMCLALAVFAPLFFLLGRRMSSRVWERTVLRNESHKVVSEQTMRVTDSIELTHSRSAEAYEISEGRERHRLLAERGAAMQFLQQMHSDTLQAILAVTVALTLLIGGAAVINGSITIGDLFAFYAGLALLRQPLARLSSGIPTVAGGVASFHRVMAFLDESAPPPYEGTHEHTIATSIGLEGVTFGYTGDPVVHDITLTLERGTVTLLVGPNGSGKSTLFNLLLGLYRPQTGRASADGIPYEQLDLAHLRSQIGAVFQTPYMIEGTVDENLRYGRPRVTDEDIETALTAATADAVVEGFRDGLATSIGGAGTKISGGQRQRIAIARALVGKPRVLLLDEPTNHLDRLSLDTVLRNIIDMEGAPAILLVSHDDRVIDVATTIVHLEEGRVVSVRAPADSEAG